MIRHIIMLASSYTTHERIAVDLCCHNEAEIERICKHTELGGDYSTYSVITESEVWSSVQEYDPFYTDVRKVDLEEFCRLVRANKELNALDVAKYILSMISCTHLKLHKLLYLAYADYLTKLGNKLFSSKIFAFPYGPVVTEIFEKLKGSRSTEGILEEKTDMKRLTNVSAHRSRILAAFDGYNKLKAVDDTLKLYGQCAASCLVAITHRPSTPWDVTWHRWGRSEIQDSVIKEFHKNEVV